MLKVVSLKHIFLLDNVVNASLVGDVGLLDADVTLVDTGTIPHVWQDKYETYADGTRVVPVDKGSLGLIDAFHRRAQELESLVQDRKSVV